MTHIDTIHSAVESIGGKLCLSFGDLISHIITEGEGAQRLATTLSINPVLAHRLVTAVRGEDARAAVHNIPGPEPLRRVVRAARRRGVPRDVAERAEAAIAEFESFIRTETGDRSGLDAILSDELPAVREKYEASAKQSVYRGMRQIKGIAADVTLISNIFHPSQTPGRADAVAIWEYIGLRCLRPGASLKLGVRSGASNPDALPLSLDGRPAADPGGVVLNQFGDGLPVEFSTIEKGQDVVYMLEWNGNVGIRSKRNIVLAELRRAGPRTVRLPDDPITKTGICSEITVPSRRFVCDVILHRDVYPNWIPRVRVLETGELGSANPNDPTRDVDELNIKETADLIGTSINRFHSADVPNYVPILLHVCETLGWDPNAFRCIRTETDYPIFSSQYQHTFEPPLIQ